MSLNFEQCKEVVERVWGYKRIEGGKGKDLPSVLCDDPDLNPTPYWIKHIDEFGSWDEIYECEIEEKVSSWEGFGRTVEAMEKEKYVWHFMKTPTGKKKYQVKFCGTLVLDDKRLRNPNETFHVCSEDFIKATHLAALEAVKQEDEG